MKNTISLDVITNTLMSHSLMRQSVYKGTQGDGLNVKEGQDHGWNKGNGGSRKKRLTSRNHKIT